MTPLKMLWFMSDRAGCGTYRTAFPALFLKDTYGIECDVVEHREVLSFAVKKQMFDLPFDFDIWVFQRAIGPHFTHLMKECRARGVKTIYEMDDDLFSVPRSNPASEFWNRKDVRRDLKRSLDLADHVITSTEPLAEVIADAMGWPDQSKISVCSNHLRGDIWGPETLGQIKPVDNTGVVIGWQGSRTHGRDFQSAATALGRVVADFETVKLRLFGDIPDVIKETVPEDRREAARGVPFMQYPATLKFMNFDIGIAPLMPSKFNESKSNLKWLEYSALGIPCVASRVFPDATSIEHGRTGFLAETEDEWYDQLAALVTDAELRNRVGRAAFAHVWAEFSEERLAPAWWRVVDRLCPGREYGPADSEFRPAGAPAAPGDEWARHAQRQMETVRAESEESR